MRGRYTASVVLNLAAALSVFFAQSSFGLADDSEDRFFQGLRDRRLFSLAEEHCISEIATGKLTPERRVSLSLELSRTYVEHAQYVSGDEQMDLWKQAAKSVDALLTVRKIQDRELLVIQRALVLSLIHI